MEIFMERVAIQVIIIGERYIIAKYLGNERKCLLTWLNGQQQ
jgi:hypothetical protein